MITIEQAMAAKHGDVFHMKNEKNADGTPVRWRVMGKIRTWKTRPNEFMIPVKNGMYRHCYITEADLDLFEMIS